MPLYNQLVMIVPKHPADQVAKCFQKYARTVLQMGGVVRTIENEGVRSLPERTQRRFPTEDGERNFWSARYVSTIIDASPECMQEASRILSLDQGVIRTHTVKLKSIQKAALGHTYKNPLLKVEKKDENLGPWKGVAPKLFV